MFIGSLALPATPALVIFFGALALGLAWTVIYSYIVWRKDPIRYQRFGTGIRRVQHDEIVMTPFHDYVTIAP